MAKKIPPQQQGRQPGIEAEMRPAPEHAPRYPGVGRLAGQGMAASA